MKYPLKTGLNFEDILIYADDIPILSQSPAQINHLWRLAYLEESLSVSLWQIWTSPFEAVE